MVLVAGDEDVEDVKKDNEKDGLGRSGSHFFVLFHSEANFFVWFVVHLRRVHNLNHPLRKKKILN